jgi:transposase
MPTLVDDQLWQLIEPLLPRPPRRYRHPGRRRLDDRRVLSGILVRPHDRNRLAAAPAGARLRLRDDLLAPPPRVATGRRLRAPPPAAARQAPSDGQARPDACGLRLRLAARAFGGAKTGPSPVDRARAGSKHHLLVDASGIPLACLLTAANCNDITQLLPLVDAIPPLRGKRGRPRRRPDTLLADRGYDSHPHRRLLRVRGIRPIIAKRNTAHGSGLGSERWVVERTLSWLHQYSSHFVRRS